MQPRMWTRRKRTKWADVLAIAGGIVLAYLLGICTGLGIWPW